MIHPLYVLLIDIWGDLVTPPFTPPLTPPYAWRRRTSKGQVLGQGVIVSWILLFIIIIIDTGLKEVNAAWLLSFW
jgi:hypothetical protein